MPIVHVNSYLALLRWRRLTPEMDNAMSEMSASPPPPGVVPQFEAPEHDVYRDNYIIYMIVCYTCTVTFCAIRGYVKFVRFEMLPDDCEFVITRI